MLDRRKALAAARLAAFPLVLLLLYLVLRGIGFRSILEAMRQASRASILSAALLVITVFVLWCFRWQQMMRPELRRSMVRIFPVYMAGVFGNIITPGARVGGEPIRAYYMSRAFGGQKSVYLGTILLDKVANASVFILMLIASVIFVAVTVPLSPVVNALLAGALLLFALIVVSGVALRAHVGLGSPLLTRLLSAVYDSAPLRFLRRRFPTYQHFEDYAILKLGNIFGPLARAATSPKTIAKAVFISLVSYGLLYGAHYVLFRGLRVEIGFAQVIVIVTVSWCFGDISVTPGGVGFMETAMIGLCAAFGVEHGAAAAVTLISRGIFYMWGLGFGGLCLLGLTVVYGRRREEEE